MATQTTENHGFEAEVGQLLDIVTHSLYTDREIFVRELVSNAADSLEKLRHLQLQGESVFDESLPLEIHIQTDDGGGVVTIQDFGIGMTRDELKENLGTIAHSGSKAFVRALREARESAEGEGGKTQDTLSLIGQFGVGFYSAFMVADEVKVYTHSSHPEGEHLLWTSDGKSGYSMETVEGQRRGAKVVLKLKEDAKEFANESRMRDILKRYSNFVPCPILLNGERINTVQAIWTRNKAEIKDEEYTEFYKFQANAFDEPLLRLHFTADAPLAIQALLYVPSTNPEKWGFGRTEPSVSLYCRKVLIDPKSEGLFPEWLRFLKGVVDSADLPLNISRESMQDSALMQKLNRVLTGRFLRFLEEEVEKRPEQYATFYKNFGIYLKEGITTATDHHDRLAKLLRFESSLTETDTTTSLADVVGRMKEEDKEIYYLFGKDRASVERSPYLEAFRARNLEVLFLYEPIDEFVMNHLREFDGKKLRSADAADLHLDDVSGDAEGEPLPEDQAQQLCSWIKEHLGDRAGEVRVSKRLVQSPVVALNADAMISPSMRRLLKAMQQDPGEVQPAHFELNPRHPLLKHLNGLRETDPETAKLVVDQLFDNALLEAGFLDNPRSMLDRIYQLLGKVGPG